jgi:GAF domain-containing protein
VWQHAYPQWRSTLLTLLALIVAGFGVRWSPAPESRTTFSLAVILVGAAAAGWIAGRLRGSHRPVRLTTTFVLCAFIVAGPPWGLVAGLTGIVMEAATALGKRRSGPEKHLERIGALILVQALASTYLPQIDPRSLLALGVLAFLFALLEALRAAWRVAAEGLRALPGGPSLPLEIGLETISIPLAWVLSVLIAEGRLSVAAAFSAAVCVCAVGLGMLHRARRDLETTNDLLAARLTELATIHAIGREMVSTLDPKRVLAIVERECRKVFTFDAFTIAVVDPGSLRLHTVYHHETGQPLSKAEEVLDAGYAHWVVIEKRGLRVDDLTSLREPLPFPRHGVSADTRSLLAAPLVVENRVTGVLAVQCRAPHAYDDHLLTVLVTIGQQAAIAIENARHYEMATVDSLTRLHLRDYFFRRLEEEHHRALRYAGTFSLLMIDLDDFKQINDRHGHLAGDLYLKALGAAILARLRTSDLACRNGGD